METNRFYCMDYIEGLKQIPGKSNLTERICHSLLPKLLRVMKQANCYIFCNKVRSPVYLNFLFRTMAVHLIFSSGTKQTRRLPFTINTFLTRNTFFISGKEGTASQPLMWRQKTYPIDHSMR